jgi:hypothetical protein
MHSSNLQRSRVTGDGGLAGEVLGYLLQHPEAQDTAEGIAEWWLLDRQVGRVMAEVKAALAGLVARGFLVARRSGDGHTHYSLNREKEREVQRYLRKTTPGGHAGRRT